MDLTINLEHIVIFAALFLSSLAVMNSFIFKPTLKILEERAKRMSGLTMEAEYFVKGYGEKLEAYNKLMQDAKELARQKRGEILKIAEVERREIIAQAEKMAQTCLAKVKSEISEQVIHTKLALEAQVKELAQMMVQKLLGRKAA